MKLANIQKLIEQSSLDIDDSELLTEGVMDAITQSIHHTKSYFTNLGNGINAKSNLKNLDGQKTSQNDNIQREVLSLRQRLSHLYTQATQGVQRVVQQAIQRVKASPLDKAYLGRNYYSDYIKYSTILPVFNLNRTNATDKVKQIIADKFVGIAITTLTGIPNLDDIKDVAELSVKAVKASNDMANKWQNLQHV